MFLMISTWSLRLQSKFFRVKHNSNKIFLMCGNEELFNGWYLDLPHGNHRIRFNTSTTWLKKNKKKKKIGSFVYLFLFVWKKNTTSSPCHAVKNHHVLVHLFFNAFTFWFSIVLVSVYFYFFYFLILNTYIKNK